MRLKKLILHLFVSFDSLAPARLALRANLRLLLLTSSFLLLTSYFAPAATV